MKSILRQEVHPARALVRYSLISAGIGVFVMLVMGVGRPGAYHPSYFVIGALIGVGINTGALIGEHLMSALPLRGWVSRVGRYVGLFVGGGSGYVAVALLISSVWTRQFPRSALVSVQAWLVFGVFAVLVGTLFETIHSLRDRLRHSVELLKEREFAERELETARTLQRRLLPPEEVRGESFLLSARNLPAQVVAGDFYDLFRYPDGAVGIVVADVVGKGMAAALRMASVKAMVPLIASERTVESAMAELNRRLAGELEAREFVALSFGRFDPRSGELEVANAGMPDPYLMRGGQATPLEVEGMRFPLGVRREANYQTLRIQLGVGDRVLWLSDGLPEAASSASGAILGYQGLRGLLEQHLVSAKGSFSLPCFLEPLEREFRDQDGRRADDWTLVVLEVTPPNPASGSLESESGSVQGANHRRGQETLRGLK